MAVVIGTSSNGGWTSIDPKPDSTFVSWSSQFGTGYTGNGTRFLCFDTSGNDSTGDGTPGNPLKSWFMIDPFYGKARNSHPDWFLFKKGQTWSESNIFDPTQGSSATSMPFGPSGGLYGTAANLATFFPLAISAWDSGASNNPPVFNPRTGSTPPKLPWTNLNALTSYVGTNGGRGQNIAYGGLDLLAPGADPTDALFANKTQNGSAISYPTDSYTAGFFGLVEGCRINHWGFGVNNGGHFMYLRRNRIRFSPGAAAEFQGSNFASAVVEENLFDCCGWVSAVPVTVNTGTGVFTLTNGPSDSDSYTQGSHRVKFYPTNGSTLPSALKSHVTYYMRDFGNLDGAGHGQPGSTFKVSLTSGGSAISVSGGSGTYFCRMATEFFTHELYGAFGGDNQFGRIDCRGNIFINDQDGGSFARGGGEFYNNTLSSGNNPLWATATASTPPPSGGKHIVSYNVFHEAATALSLGGAGRSYQFNQLQHDTLGDGVDSHHNIVAHTGSVGGGTAIQYEMGSHGGTKSHDLVYDWGSYDHGVNNSNPAFGGFLRKFTILNAGTGGDGRVATFEREYPPGSSGFTSKGAITGGTIGYPGFYGGIACSGGSGTGAICDVTVGSGGNVTTVSLTTGGDLAFANGDNVTAAAGGPSATVSITIASPAVVTWAGNQLIANAPVTFSTSGSLPTGIVAGTTYFVRDLGVDGTDKFRIAATAGGSAINTSGSQSGTQTITVTNGLPLSWSFKIYPYIFEVRPASGSGTGCQLYAIVTDNGQINPPNYLVRTTNPLDYAGVGFFLSRSQGPYGYIITESVTYGGLKISAGGTQYSSGQTLLPFGTLISGPPGKALSDLPSGFNIKVGPYPAISKVSHGADPGLTLTPVSGSGTTGGQVATFFTTTAGITTVTDVWPYTSGDGSQGVGTSGVVGGFAVNDILNVQNYAGMTGVQVKCTEVSANTDDGTSDYNSAGPHIGSFPYLDPTRNFASYMTAIGNPGAFPSTMEGFLDAVDQLQTPAGWNGLLMAESYNDYIREGFGFAMQGSAYATLSGAVIPGALPTTGTVGVAYSGSAAATGGTGPYTYALTSGSLPTGVGPLNTSTGAVTGTPTTPGVYAFRITATDSLSVPGFRDYGVTISGSGGGGITVSPSSLPNGTVGTSYSQTITASGGTGPYTFAVTAGSIPTGLTPLTSGGVLAGTPTVAGSYSFSVTATDSLSATSSPQAYNVTISSAAPPAILMPQICM